ncbi:MAG: alpha/beta hydrolase [Burkholderiaceae bacterium]|nr:alpha/beta hydrolase [Burkholderiaceae bacterium]
MSDKRALFRETGGTRGPLLLMLHGLGANGMVWEPMKAVLASRWRGRWMIPDFRGHGRSPHCGRYSIEGHAADVARLVEKEEEIFILGHSMGGLVGVALASTAFGICPKQVIAFAVKTSWSDEELAWARAFAATPPKRFGQLSEAVTRYLRVSGLAGLISPESPAARAGIVEENGHFRLAADPLAYDLGKPDIEEIASAARSPLFLLCGERDPIASRDEMRRLGSSVSALPCGHNPHVEAPETLWRAIERRFVEPAGRSATAPGSRS